MNGTIFLHRAIIRVVVGGVVIVFGELIVSGAPGSLDVGAPSLPGGPPLKIQVVLLFQTGANSSSSLMHVLRKKVTENQTNHVVATRINRGVIVTQYHLLRNNGCRKNHGSGRIKHLFPVSQQIILQNHASRRLWKSRFTGKK